MQESILVSGTSSHMHCVWMCNEIKGSYDNIIITIRTTKNITVCCWHCCSRLSVMLRVYQFYKSSSKAAIHAVSIHHVRTDVILFCCHCGKMPSNKQHPSYQIPYLYTPHKMPLKQLHSNITYVTTAVIQTGTQWWQQAQNTPLSICEVQSVLSYNLCFTYCVIHVP